MMPMARGIWTVRSRTGGGKRVRRTLDVGETEALGRMALLITKGAQSEIQTPEVII